MITTLAICLAAATQQAPTQTPAGTVVGSGIPDITITESGRRVELESITVRDATGRLVTHYREARAEVPLDVVDGTGGAIPVTPPSIVYDQPLMLCNSRTGEIVTIPGGTTTRRPVVRMRH